MARTQIHVGLEVGTTKICAVVAETRADAPPRILAVGEAPSRGVRKGEIVDFSTATKCVLEAINDADEKSGIEIKSVWAAVTGSHIASFNNKGAINIPSDKHEIDEEDLRDVELNAREVNIPSANYFLHTLIQNYQVDGQEGVLDPLGMVGHRLEANFHIVHGVRTRIENTIRCIRECGVEVEDVVVNSVASAQNVLDPQQKEQGVVVLDIGGGVTDYVVYLDGSVHHSGVLAVGGDHLTSDLSNCLRIPMSKAEKLKVEEGSCLLSGLIPGDTILLKNDAGFSGCEVERSLLNTIIRDRMEEVLQLVRRDMERVGGVHVELLGSGVVLTGGCSQLKGLRELAVEVFELPAELASAHDVAGPTPALKNPSHSTAIGLVKYAQVVGAVAENQSILENLFGIFRKKASLF
jgi:cell division protein FtsA